MAFKEEYQAAFSAVRPSAEFDPEEIYMKATKKYTPMRRFVSIAAAAVLLLALSVTAYATDLFGLMEFIMPDAFQSSTLPDDASPNASDRQYISISGYVDSPEAEAAAEWKQYYLDYILNTEIEYEKDDLPINASYYGAYNDEMYAKLNEIADKYGVSLVTEEGYTEGYRVGHTLEGTETWFYQYGNGNFKEESTFTASDGLSIGYSLIRTVKGSLTTNGFEIWDADSWTCWDYMSSTGDAVALGLSNDLYEADGSYLGNRGLIMADLGDCFVTAIVINFGEPITETAMQELAEHLDYVRLATVA